MIGIAPEWFASTLNINNRVSVGMVILAVVVFSETMMGQIPHLLH
jgi:hypothetical protein